jgi:type IV secretory pathway VirB10-like protein
MPQNAFGAEAMLHRGLGEAVLQTANQMAQQASQMPPTLEVRQGERFLITLSKDIVFPSPYADGIAQRRDRRRPRERPADRHERSLNTLD